MKKSSVDKKTLLTVTGIYIHNFSHKPCPASFLFHLVPHGIVVQPDSYSDLNINFQWKTFLEITELVNDGNVERQNVRRNFNRIFVFVKGCDWL